MSNSEKLDKIKCDLEMIKVELWYLPIEEREHKRIKKSMNDLLDELDFVEFIKN